MTNAEKATAFIEGQQFAFDAMMKQKIKERGERDSEMRKAFKAWLEEQRTHILETGEMKPPQLLTTVPPKMIKPTTPQSLYEVMQLLAKEAKAKGITTKTPKLEGIPSEEELKAELNALSSNSTESTDGDGADAASA